MPSIAPPLTKNLDQVGVRPETGQAAAPGHWPLPQGHQVMFSVHSSTWSSWGERFVQVPSPAVAGAV